MTLTMYTWKGGSKGLGFKTPVKSMLLGGNVGHAAMELTWPANESGDILAKKYQDNQGIQISKRTEYVPERQEDGSYKAREQIVYFAYFSWWPGVTNGHYINSQRDDKLAEWRHEPGRKISTVFREKLLVDGEMPDINKTTVTGMFVRDKEIEKVRDVSHPSLQKDIATDTAYTQLKRQEADLVQENDKLAAKGALYVQEMDLALREQRPPDKTLNLTEEEYQRSAEINKELLILGKQIKACVEDFEERHKTEGRLPDAVVRLPTNNDEHSLTFALDTEKILDEMVTLSQSHTAYSFHQFNCSTAASQVLMAGIGDELKEKMKEDGLKVNNLAKAVIATPTTLNHLSIKIQAELNHLNCTSAQQNVSPEATQSSAEVKSNKDLSVNYRKQIRDISNKGKSDLENETPKNEMELPKIGT